MKKRSGILILSAFVIIAVVLGALFLYKDRFLFIQYQTDGLYGKEVEMPWDVWSVRHFLNETQKETAEELEEKYGGNTFLIINRNTKEEFAIYENQYLICNGDWKHAYKISKSDDMPEKLFEKISNEKQEYISDEILDMLE